MIMTRDAYGKLGSFNTRREGSGSPPSFGRLRCAASKAVLDELLGGLKDGGTTTALGSASRKECKAAVRLAKHMQGDKRGQVSGKAFYTIVPCVSRLCACCLSTVCGSASRCLCACCASVCRVCGSRSSRVCVCASERVLGWQATRLAVKKTVIKCHHIAFTKIKF